MNKGAEAQRQMLSQPPGNLSDLLHFLQRLCLINWDAYAFSETAQLDLKYFYFQEVFLPFSSQPFNVHYTLCMEVRSQGHSWKYLLPAGSKERSAEL